MGLKKNNYMVEEFSIEIPTAYAICIDLSSHKHGNTKAVFGVYRNREEAYNDEKSPVECHTIAFSADKTTPLWEQAYVEAKAEVFTDWEDDIPNE